MDIISLCCEPNDERNKKMAKIKLDPLFAEISGTLGDLVFKKSRNGEAIVSRRPRKSNTEPSPAQKAQRERFRLAAAYARAALADPEVGASYRERAAKEGMSPFALARADYFAGYDLLSKS
jgi:hypothetical protein